jgi:hypothetical protein
VRHGNPVEETSLEIQNIDPTFASKRLVEEIKTEVETVAS